MDKILVNIAGIPFTLRIQTIIRPFYQKSLLNTIYQVLGPYIINNTEKSDHKPEIKIFFQKKPVWELVQDKGNGSKQFYSFFYEEYEKKYIVHYPIGILQLRFLLKRIVEKALYKKGGLILHCSSCIFNKRTYLFIAKRGGGKSTILGMFLRAGAIPLGDDNAIIIRNKRKLVLYQTPFIETNYSFEKTNKSYDVDNLIFLRKSDTNTIKPVYNYSKAMSMLGKQVIIREWWGSNQTKTLMELVKSKQFYLLNFSKDFSAFRHFVKKEPFS